MTLTTHSIVGAAIANLMPANPEFGFALAYASHYLSDMIPHAELVSEESIIEKDDPNNFSYKAKNLKSIFFDAKSSFGFLIIGIDFLVALALCWLLFVRNRQSLIATIAGVAGGLLPDFLQFLYYKFKKEPWTFFQKIHHFFHSENHMENSPVLGSLPQIFLPILFVIFYFLTR